MVNISNKIKYIILYILSLILISSPLFILSGCTPAQVLNKSPYDNNSGLQKKLENKVMALSLKLNGVPGKKVKLKVLAKSGGISDSQPLYRPSFMVKTSDISDGNVKYAENRKITVDKSVKSPDGKLVLKVKSVEFKNILEIVNISIKNLYLSAIRYRLLLFKGEGAAVRRVSFESNVGSPAGSHIAGRTEIKGSIVFVRRQKSAGLTLAVPVLRKNRFSGGIKLVKLIYKFAGAGNLFPNVAH